MDRRGECNGSITLNKEDDVVRQTSHTHGPDWGRCQATELTVQIKETAETSRASTSAIVQATVARATSEAAMRLPKQSSMKRAVKRVKRQHLPQEPRSLEELHDLPQKFKTTAKGMLYVIIVSTVSPHF